MFTKLWRCWSSVLEFSDCCFWRVVKFVTSIYSNIVKHKRYSINNSNIPNQISRLHDFQCIYPLIIKNAIRENQTRTQIWIGGGVELDQIIWIIRNLNSWEWIVLFVFSIQTICDFWIKFECNSCHQIRNSSRIFMKQVKVKVKSFIFVFK